MTHEIIIETHQMRDGTFRAYVTEGPESAIGFWCSGNERRATYQAAAAGVRTQYPALEISTLHAET